MRPWLVLLLAACGAVETPAPARREAPAQSKEEPKDEPETVVREGRAATHEEALGEVG